jgi:hypothetical protein
MPLIRTAKTGRPPKVTEYTLFKNQRMNAGAATDLIFLGEKMPLPVSVVMIPILMEQDGSSGIITAIMYSRTVPALVPAHVMGLILREEIPMFPVLNVTDPIRTMQTGPT